MPRGNYSTNRAFIWTSMAPRALVAGGDWSPGESNCSHFDDWRPVTQRRFNQ